jgi:phage head maturation protease
MGEVDRFNPYHAKAGSPTGGQFASSSGGSGGGTAKAPAGAKSQAPPPDDLALHARLAEKKRLLAQAHKDEQRARELEKELHGLQQQEHAAAAAAAKSAHAAAHAKTQAAKAHAHAAAAAKRGNVNAQKTAAAAKAKHTAAHHHHATHHHHHTQHAKTLRQRITALKTEIHGLREHAAALEKRAEAVRAAGADGLELWQLLARTAQTATASTVHHPLGKPGGPGLWHTGKQLPAYIQNVAKHLIATHGESRGIEMAVGIVKNWAAGHDGHGNRVHPDVQAAASKAVAEWEKLRAEAHSTKARRSTVATASADGDYDGDGLDSSWDGDHSDLPDLTGLHVHHFEAAAGDAPGEDASRAMPKLGTGARFAKLKSSLAAKGAHDPGALAAYIGRKKFGKAKFTKLAAKARGGRSAQRFADWEPRPFPLEDIHILTRAEGDGSGRVVEAYATVFDVPAEIKDHQGHYTEVIDRGAFDQVLDRHRRAPGGLARAVKVLYNHGKTAEGTPAPEFQVPIGIPLDIRPEARGLLTRTEYDTSDPFTERILGKIRVGAITAQSFVGSIMRSSPELRGPGDRYRARDGALVTVRRMMLGLREYGPVLWPAYSGAEILGVRMQLPGSFDEELDFTDDEEYTPETERDVTGGAPEDATSSRYHQHVLYAMRSRELREAKGLVL